MRPLAREALLDRADAAAAQRPVGRPGRRRSAADEPLTEEGRLALEEADLDWADRLADADNAPTALADSKKLRTARLKYCRERDVAKLEQQRAQDLAGRAWVPRIQLPNPP